MNGFRGIKGLETLYGIDVGGAVYSHKKGIILKLSLNSNGYHHVKLAGKTRMVHRLMAEAFLLDYLEKPQVNHINGVKTDNYLSNLEMVTASENTQHAYDTGLKKATSGVKNDAQKSGLVSRAEC